MTSEAIPRSKGTFSFDRPNLVRAAIATAAATLTRKYAIDNDAKLKDLTNLLVFPVFLAYDKLDDEIYLRTGYRALSGAVGVAIGCTVIAATFYSMERKDLLTFGGACGAIILISDSLVNSNASSWLRRS